MRRQVLPDIDTERQQQHDEQYRRALTYVACHFDPDHPYWKEEKGIEAQIHQLANKVGIITGEAASVVVHIMKALNIANTSSFIISAALAPISYALYSLGALFICFEKIRQLFKKNTIPPDSAFLPPREYVISTILGAIANFFVCVAYTLVSAMLGMIYAGTLIMTPALPLAIATIGTLISWIGNNFIDTWRAEQEFNKVNQLQDRYPAIDGLPQVTIKNYEKYQEELTRRRLGFFMVMGMAFLALSFYYVAAPIVPLLHISSLTALCFISMGVYAAKDIYKGAAWVFDKLNNLRKRCCCYGFENDNKLKSGPDKLSDLDIQGQLSKVPPSARPANSHVVLDGNAIPAVPVSPRSGGDGRSLFPAAPSQLGQQSNGQAHHTAAKKLSG